MTLDIIIVSYNTSRLLNQCLKAVYTSLSFAKLKDRTRVIVVDNASTDDSCDLVKKKYPQVVLLQNIKNLGFAKANNQGIKRAVGKYILLLNSDTRVRKEAFLKLLEVAKGHNKIGVVGVELINADGSIQPSAGFFPHLIKVFLWMSFIDDIPFLSYLIKPYHVDEKSFYKKFHRVDWVSGACLLIRKDVLGQVGLLDEQIFMYGEEVEWCYRVKKIGFEIVYTPEAKVIHHKGRSSKANRQAGIVDEFESLIYFYRKHKPKWQLFLLRGFLMFGAVLRIVLFGIIGRREGNISLYAKAFSMARQ